MHASLTSISGVVGTMGSIFSLRRWAFRKAFHLAAVLAGYDSITGVRIRRLRKVERIGSDYGGCLVPRDFLTANSVCYCVGVGEDITFDLGLIDRFGCEVYAFDPTPRSIAFV